MKTNDYIALIHLLLNQKLPNSLLDNKKKAEKLLKQVKAGKKSLMKKTILDIGFVSYQTRKTAIINGEQYILIGK